MIYNYVYITTNNINGKQYVGVHKTRNLNDGYLGSGKILKRAVKKYGKENFTIEILEFYDTFEEALKNEIILIKEYNTIRPNGYNIALGGYGGDTYSNQPKIKKEKTRKKQSKARKGRYAIYNEKLNKSKYVKEEELSQYLKENWKLGFSQKTKRKMRKAAVGKLKSKEHIKHLSKASKNRIWIHKDDKNKFVKEKKLSYYLNNNWKLGVSEESKRKNSEATKGRIWIYNKELKQNKMIYLKNKQEYLGNNWKLGMFKTKK